MPRGRRTAWPSGAEPGFFDINVTRHDVFSSFREPIAFAAERFGHAAEVARHERVAVRRLEDVLDELFGSGPPPRYFLKMDTQGYDLEVFAGLGRWAEHVVGLQSEVAAIPLCPVCRVWPRRSPATRRPGSS